MLVVRSIAGGSLALGLVLSVSGCSMRPPRVEAPQWNPDRFADRVLEELDTDGDGALSKAETAAAPGLAAGASQIDSDGDGSLTREELVARFGLYKQMRLAIVSKDVVLLVNGKRAKGVALRFEPEFFLTDLVEPAADVTLGDGSCRPQAEGCDLPGMRPGYYRLVAAEPSQAGLPSEYGSPETTPTGIEVSPVSDGPQGYGPVVVRISKK